MKKHEASLSVTHLRVKEALDYFPLTGEFVWKIRGGSRRAVGDRAGFIYGPYIGIGIDGKIYLAHRLAWFWMTGAWPNAEIDHKNRDGHDNSWANLREATSSQNRANSLRPNKTGFKGVSLHRKTGLYHATAWKDGKKQSLGYFRDPIEAYAAYAVAAQSNFGEFAQLRAEAGGKV